MKIQLWPKTTAGIWATSLTLLFIVLMSLKLSTLAMLIRLPLPTPLIAVIGVAGFIVGVVSIIKNKDRALLKESLIMRNSHHIFINLILGTGE